jgi:hypothetical protein
VRVGHQCILDCDTSLPFVIVLFWRFTSKLSRVSSNICFKMNAFVISQLGIPTDLHPEAVALVFPSSYL